jgi:plasmid stabilization system protein ParE
MKIEFSQNAYHALEQIAEYVYEKSRSRQITAEYIRKIRTFIFSMLSSFPRAGRSAEEFGEGIRKLVYQRYSILYKIIDNDHIVILTIYRENLPHV